MSRRTAAEVIDEALHHLEIAAVYAERDLTEQLVIDAASLRLAAGIDALAKLDDATRERLFGSTWRNMKGMRNHIAHGYFLVDGDLVRSTLRNELPGVLAVLRQEAEAAGPA